VLQPWAQRRRAAQAWLEDSAQQQDSAVKAGSGQARQARAHRLEQAPRMELRVCAAEAAVGAAAASHSAVPEHPAQFLEALPRRRAPAAAVGASIDPASAAAPTSREGVRTSEEAASNARRASAVAQPDAAEPKDAAPSTAFQSLAVDSLGAVVGLPSNRRRPCPCWNRRPFDPSQKNQHSNAFPSERAATKTAVFEVFEALCAALSTPGANRFQTGITAAARVA